MVCIGGELGPLVRSEFDCATLLSKDPVNSAKAAFTPRNDRGEVGESAEFGAKSLLESIAFEKRPGEWDECPGTAAAVDKCIDQVHH
mmetsp:Transcript_31024/g.48359  ORF Transcript_31024/g.48359 Transcript_31024/m.48359 type:complete len:87 (+) Transcript_31024:55-315(+)